MCDASDGGSQWEGWIVRLDGRGGERGRERGIAVRVIIGRLESGRHDASLTDVGWVSGGGCETGWTGRVERDRKEEE